MNLFQFLLMSISPTKEDIAFQNSIDVCFYSAYGLILVLLIAIIINHLRLKKLFSEHLLPFFAMFIIHPIWLSFQIQVSSSLREIWAFGIVAASVVWLIVFILLTNKKAKNLKNQKASED